VFVPSNFSSNKANGILYNAPERTKQRERDGESECAVL